MPALKAAKDACDEVEDCREGEEGDDEGCEIDGHPVVVEVELVAPSRSVVVPHSGVAVKHLSSWDGGDAVDLDRHVVGLVKLESTIPVCKVEGEEDHDRVDEAANGVQKPDPLRLQVNTRIRCVFSKVRKIRCAPQ